MIFELIQICKTIYDKGYVVAAGGNISYRISSDRILIKRSGKSFGALTPEDFIIINLNDSSPEASIDLPIHQAIYLNSEFKAVIHAHPPHTIVLSNKINELEPIDFETKLKVGAIPVVNIPHEKLYLIIGDYVRQGYKAIIERNHGVYIWGRKLTECLSLLEMIERAAQVFLLNKMLK